jgi:glucose-1-phosphate thymidylyltransferase
MKGFLLAGGSATLPVYDQPAICYPLSLLMLAGIRDIRIVAPDRDLPGVKKLLGDGADLGLSLSYRADEGTAGFLSAGPCCVVRGDTVLHGAAVADQLAACARLKGGAVVLVNPAARANWSAPGVAFYDARVAELARGAPSLADVHRAYREAGQLTVLPPCRGMTWLDLGTPEARLTAALVAQVIEQATGTKLACVEEIALRLGFIGPAQFERLVEKYSGTAHARYLRRALRECQEVSPPVCESAPARPAAGPPRPAVRRPGRRHG